MLLSLEVNGSHCSNIAAQSTIWWLYKYSEFLATIDSCTYPDTVSYAGDMSVRKLKYEIFKVLYEYIHKVGPRDSCKKHYLRYSMYYIEI